MARPPSPPREVPGAACTALRDVLTGAPQPPGRVVAALPTCLYADLAGRLVAVEAAGGLRLPCAVLLGADGTAAQLSAVRVGDPVQAFRGVLRLGPLQVRVVRWWSPATPRDASPRAPLPIADPRWEALVRPLLGLGPGLTPAGDDLLAGLLVGLAGRPDLRDPLAAAVDRLAAGRTTWLSAQLLRLAGEGLAAPVVIAVADALAGHGADDALESAVPALLRVGATSGAALAYGLLLAATTLAPRSGVRSAA